MAKPRFAKMHYKCTIFVVRFFFAMKHFAVGRNSGEAGFEAIVCPVLSAIENDLTEDKKRKRSTTTSRPPARKEKERSAPAKTNNSELRKKRERNGSVVADAAVGVRTRLAPVVPEEILANDECDIWMLPGVTPHGRVKKATNECDAAAGHASDVNSATSTAANTERYDDIMATIQKDIDFHRKAEVDHRKQADDSAKKARDLQMALENLKALKQEDREKKKKIEAEVRQRINKALGGEFFEGNE